VDVASVELFVDNGIIVMTEIFFPTETYATTSLFAENGMAKLVSGEIYPLEAAGH
jgi:sucrose-6-phosphate hydrolase SacC (GH32 family)